MAAAPRDATDGRDGTGRDGRTSTGRTDGPERQTREATSASGKTGARWNRRSAAARSGSTEPHRAPQPSGRIGERKPPDEAGTPGEQTPHPPHIPCETHCSGLVPQVLLRPVRTTSQRTETVQPCVVVCYCAVDGRLGVSFAPCGGVQRQRNVGAVWRVVAGVGGSSRGDPSSSV